MAAEPLVPLAPLGVSECALLGGETDAARDGGAGESRC